MSTAEQEAAVKSSATESAATATRRGLELDMESLSTSLPAPTVEATRLKTVSGDAEAATDATRDVITQDRSSPLSADEEQRLYRIRKDRANRFMVSAPDVDFLLEIVERLRR
jgi:hypothetical protein